MKNVSHWLPPNINCAYQVFSLDEYAETVHSTNIALALPKSLQQASRSRQISYRAGRNCAIQALTTAGLAAVTTLDRTGDGLPEWPEGWVGSISHALAGQTGIAIAVVAHRSTTVAVAVDCEPVFSTAHALEIAPLIVSSNEQSLGARLGYPHALWLTMVYSLKETLYKLLYAHVRCFMPFEAAELLSFDTQTGQGCLMLSQDWGNVTRGTRYWLQAHVVTVEAIGDCILSFAAVQA